MTRTKSHIDNVRDFQPTALGVFLEPDGRLPGFAQRRVDSLIAKKKTASLSGDEERELNEALDYIDTKSAQLLKSSLRILPEKPKRGARAASVSK